MATTTSSPGSSAPATGRRSTTSSSSRPSALALLRAGADIHAAAAGRRCSRSRRSLRRAARRRAGGVPRLEAAKPSRKTHKYFPEPRARAVRLRVGQWFKRLPSDFPIQFEVWETFVMPHMVTRDYQPPAAA